MTNDASMLLAHDAEGRPIHLGREELLRHAFVVGATGSGRPTSAPPACPRDWSAIRSPRWPRTVIATKARNASDPTTATARHPITPHAASGRDLGRAVSAAGSETGRITVGPPANGVALPVGGRRYRVVPARGVRGAPGGGRSFA